MNSDFDALETRLRGGFEAPLPGVQAQLLLAPSPRRGWNAGAFPDDARPGAALLVMYPIDGVPHVLLTVRDDGLPYHGGQVSLPGGAVESGESHQAAALREAHEEVGLAPERVHIVGSLSRLHVPVSRFVIHPVVGLAAGPSRWAPHPGEVARVLEVSIGELTDPATLGVERRWHEGQPVDVPYFAVDGERVWGATAMILSEFLCVLGYPPRPRG